MSIMSGLAAAGHSRGHLILFPATLDWLATIKQFMVQKNVIEKLEAGMSGGRHNSSHLLGNISSVIILLLHAGGCGLLLSVCQDVSP